MNRNLLIGAIVVIAAALGYYQFGYKPAQERAAAEVSAATEAAAKAAADAEKAAAEAAKKAADEKAAAEAAAKAEADAAAKAAADAAAKAEADAAAAAAATAEAATEATTAAVDLFDPAKFDVAGLTGLVDKSSLDDTTKAALKKSIEAAGKNQALIQPVLTNLKSALGM